MKRLLGCVYVMVSICVLVLMQACSPHSAEWPKLEMAESLIARKAESAQSVLEQVNTLNLDYREDKARYALLCATVALAEGRDSAISAKSIQPAIDYYLPDGENREKFRTYVCKGCVALRMGDEDQAMENFLYAAEYYTPGTDSLVLAHLLVEQSVLYRRQYKLRASIDNNMRAAGIFSSFGKYLQAMDCYATALHGALRLTDRDVADTIVEECRQLAERYPAKSEMLEAQLLAYDVRYGEFPEVAATLDELAGIMEADHRPLSVNLMLNMANGYAALGDDMAAAKMLGRVEGAGVPLDSMEYLPVKVNVLEAEGEYREALRMERIYNGVAEAYQRTLRSQKLMFADDRHRIEMARMTERRQNDQIISGCVCAVLLLVILTGISYRFYLRGRERRRAVQEENERLLSDGAELNRMNEQLESKYKASRMQGKSLEEELDVVYDKVEALLNERDRLKGVIVEMKKAGGDSLGEVYRMMLALKSQIAKGIAQNEDCAQACKGWIDSVYGDRDKFMDSIRLVFTASNPEFITYLRSRDLTDTEINYVCLYALGLRGKEVGNFMQSRSHYNLSSQIRKKLGIDEHQTNLSIYVQHILNGPSPQPTP